MISSSVILIVTVRVNVPLSNVKLPVAPPLTVWSAGEVAVLSLTV